MQKTICNRASHTQRINSRHRFSELRKFRKSFKQILQKRISVAHNYDSNGIQDGDLIQATIIFELIKKNQFFNSTHP